MIYLLLTKWYYKWAAYFGISIDTGSKVIGFYLEKENIIVNLIF
jgi:hypothetical protein